MVDRPIAFSAPMVRALLAGTKTQTRRIATVRVCGGKRLPMPALAPDVSHAHAIATPAEAARVAGPCPFGARGDRLWVREALQLDTSVVGMGDPASRCATAYTADDRLAHDAAGALVPWPFKNRGVPPMHCPRRLSRITLEITDTRIERLQEISEADALAEGTKAGDFWPGASEEPRTAREAFRDLINSIHGDGTWDANPWVWVVAFRRVSL